MAQDLEFCGSLNTSSEQRFKNAPGIGLQYTQDLGRKLKAGAGIHYNFNKIQFDYIPYIDADPTAVVADRISSNSQHFSIRLNLQILLKNNDNVSISVGPEISYNYLWGKDQIEQRASPPFGYSEYSQYNGLSKKFGVGMISIVEIKNFIDPKLSFCLTFKPEILLGNNIVLMGANSPVFSGIATFSEFQVGLKYKFKIQ